MNRGDEADGPVAKGDPFAPAAPGETDQPASGHGPDSSSHFAVVIFGDGSAAIDGESVPVVPGEPLDVAILDMLHGYARSRNAPVTGAISDPSAGYVAIVEVAPDGSSQLLEQLQEQQEKGGGTEESAELTELTGPIEQVEPVEPVRFEEPVEPFAYDKPSSGAGLPDADRAADAVPESAKPRTAPVALQQVTSGGSARSRTRSQSDDEYERPGLLQRPLVLGGVAAGVAVLVIGSLVALGSGSSGAQEQSQATGSDNEASSSPMLLRPPSSAPATPLPPPVSVSPSISPSESPSKRPSKPPAKEPSKSPSVPALPKAVPTKPKESRKSADDLLVPDSTVVLENQEYGYCVDLFGQGKGRSGATVYDDHSCITSGKDNQLWTLKVALKGRGHGGSDLYAIRNTKDGFCLDLPGEGPAAGGKHVVEYNCKATVEDNQLWWFQRGSDGTYRIRNHKSGNKCLDVDRKSAKAENAPLMVYVCSDSADQRWRLIRT
ncbi:RICIN domain-containing protein [Streptomyces sp. NPDC006285]|uniref:RICIN domain-containing protein n=1 Tax=Streptomyces sp. NPDC006285 TaxID=3364742 RepID=UPI00368C55AE